jgi:hypothetical protein
VEGSEEPCLLQAWRLCAWIEGNLELFLCLFIVPGFVRVLTDMINLNAYGRFLWCNLLRFSVVPISCFLKSVFLGGTC